jgi:hypothetical protein
MLSNADIFDRSSLELAPLASRIHDLGLTNILPLQAPAIMNPTIQKIARRIRAARQNGSAVILMMGAHVIRSGVQRFIIDLMEKKYLSCVALNGAGIVHDFEYALIGATTESVREYIREGRFGFWRETGRINDITTEAMKENRGLGEAVGRVIEEENFPHRDISILAAGYRMRIPVTAHVAIGCDIVHQLPNCDGAAYGATSYRDFLRFAKAMEAIEDGVVMNFGSAVTAPEVYLKALSMVRNLARRHNRRIGHFSTLVCDLVRLPGEIHAEPDKNNPFYYFRPWKTMLVRTVADGGESYYVCGRHRETIPQLWSATLSETNHD